MFFFSGFSFYSVREWSHLSKMGYLSETRKITNSLEKYCFSFSAFFYFFLFSVEDEDSSVLMR